MGKKKNVDPEEFGKKLLEKLTPDDLKKVLSLIGPVSQKKPQTSQRSITVDGKRPPEPRGFFETHKKAVIALGIGGFIIMFLIELHLYGLL